MKKLILFCLTVAACGVNTSPRREPADHRASAPLCAAERGAGTPGGGAASCTKDADCTQGANGRCMEVTICGGPCQLLTECTYDACGADADCAPRGVCVCRTQATANTANYCLASGTCRTDADCGDQKYCSPSPGACGRPPTFYCHTSGDECIDDADCDAGVCRYDTTLTRWRCTVPDEPCPL